MVKKKEEAPPESFCDSCEYDIWCEKKYPERIKKIHCSVWKKKGSP